MTSEDSYMIGTDLLVCHDDDEYHSTGAGLGAEQQARWWQQFRYIVLPHRHEQRQRNLSSGLGLQPLPFLNIGLHIWISTLGLGSRLGINMFTQLEIKLIIMFVSIRSVELNSLRLAVTDLTYMLKGPVRIWLVWHLSRCATASLCRDWHTTLK
jgi:hypothetical protein